MRDHTRDKVEGGAGDGNAPVRVGVDVPVGDELAVIVGDVRSGEGRMAEIAADVFGGIKAFWIEAIGFDLIAAMVVVALVDGLAQLVVEGTRLAEMLAQ